MINLRKLQSPNNWKPFLQLWCIKNIQTRIMFLFLEGRNRHKMFLRIVSTRINVCCSTYVYRCILLKHVKWNSAIVLMLPWLWNCSISGNTLANSAVKANSVRTRFLCCVFSLLFVQLCYTNLMECVLHPPRDCFSFCRTLITRTSGTEVTSIGACSLLTRWLLRRWFWLRSPWSLRRQIWSNPHCWRSLSATLVLWPLSTTSPPVPLLRAAAVFSTRDFPAVVDRKLSLFFPFSGKNGFLKWSSSLTV